MIHSSEREATRHRTLHLDKDSTSQRNINSEAEATQLKITRLEATVSTTLRATPTMAEEMLLQITRSVAEATPFRIPRLEATASRTTRPLLASRRTKTLQLMATASMTTRLRST